MFAMRRWPIVVLIAVGTAFGLMLVSGLILQSLVSGSAKDRLVASLGQSLGAPITVGSAGFELSQWFRFRPSVALEDVVIGNPPGFHSKDLLEAKRISVQVALGPLLHKAIEVRSILIDEPRITVETNERGLTNAGEVLKKISATPGGGGGPGLAIDDLALEAGTLSFVSKGAVNVNDIVIRLRDFSGDRRCHMEASAKLFGGRNSNFKLDAQAGPFSSESLPLQGTLSLNIAPAEIPAAIRKEQFGTILDAPGDKGQAHLEGSIQGDLYKTLTGPAKLVLSNIQIGSGQHHELSLSGEAPATLTASNLLASPSVDLKIPGAKLQLGKGEWTGDAEFQMNGPAVNGSIRGAIRNVDINQMLSSLASANEKIHGVLTLPSFSLQFAGKNGNEIQKSLHGSGKLSISQGRLAATDLVATLERALGQAQQLTAGANGSTPGASGSTPFDTLTADLAIAQTRIDVSNLVMNGPALRATGHGVIGFDESLNFEMNAQVTGGLAHLVNTASMRAQSDTAELPFTITGRAGAVQVRPAVRKMATDTVKGLINSFLKGKAK
jgi:uncharacterized protein involved in outer membrane biogenesis